MNWDEYYMNIAFAVREKANCSGNRVGAVIVKDNRVISTGYNGVPEGMPNCSDGGCLRCRNTDGMFPSGSGYDLCICVHAEASADWMSVDGHPRDEAGAHAGTTKSEPSSARSGSPDSFRSSGSV